MIEFVRYCVTNNEIEIVGQVPDRFYCFELYEGHTQVCKSNKFPVYCWKNLGISIDRYVKKKSNKKAYSLSSLFINHFWLIFRLKWQQSARPMEYKCCGGKGNTCLDTQNCSVCLVITWRFFFLFLSILLNNWTLNEEINSKTKSHPKDLIFLWHRFLLTFLHFIGIVYRLVFNTLFKVFHFTLKSSNQI